MHSKIKLNTSLSSKTYIYSLLQTDKDQMLRIFACLTQNLIQFFSTSNFVFFKFILKKNIYIIINNN